MWKWSLGKKPTWPAPAQRKKMPGRKWVATSSTDLESHPVIKIPPSDKNAKLDLAQPPTPSYPELHLALEIKKKAYWANAEAPACPLGPDASHLHTR